MAAATTLNLTRVDVREILMQNDIVRLHTRCGSNICNSNRSWDNGVSWNLWRARAFVQKFWTTRKDRLAAHLITRFCGELIYQFEIIVNLICRQFGSKMPIRTPRFGFWDFTLRWAITSTRYANSTFGSDFVLNDILIDLISYTIPELWLL